MSKLLGLLMKKHFKFPCFGSTLKVCIVLIILTFATSLACFGGGYYGSEPYYPDEDGSKYRNATDSTLVNSGIDDTFVVNLTNIKDPLERNIKTAWRGWKPSDETQKEWREWHKKWLEENAKNGGDFIVPGKPGAQDFSAERGPGSGWPNLPGWADLGKGSDGAPVPPWAYVPKNIGKPTICYLPPLLGTCSRGQGERPTVERWGYNPYVDECQTYTWSTCGGTRNKFVTKEACDKHCAVPPPQSCSSDSGILDKSSKKKKKG